MKYSTLRAQLRQRLTRNETLVVPGVFDAMSAKLVEAAGFQAVHAGSFSFASSMGLPDVGLLNCHDICSRVASIAEAVGIPVIADAEDGFVGPAGIQRVVHAFEQAGACAIHIEDHQSGKHTSAPRRVVPLSEICEKIRAAVEARQDPNFLIIARTDVAWATQRSEDAVERAQAFAAAGADIVMPVGLSIAELGRVRARIEKPVMIVNAEGNALEAESAAGADIVIYHSFCIDAAAGGIQRALSTFNSTKNIRSLDGTISTHDEVEALLGYQAYDAQRVRFQ